MTPVVSAAVEGLLDEAVALRLVEHAGATVGLVYGRKGKGYLKDKVAGFNQAARHAPWLVVTDLDADEDCAPRLVRLWLPEPAPLMCFRVAVREMEAWLLADRERMATFLGVAEARVPRDPEALPNPKEAVVALARRSRRRNIREDLIPRPTSDRAVGPGYDTRMAEFAFRHWRPDVAAEVSDSLRSCLAALQRLKERSPCPHTSISGT